MLQVTKTTISGNLERKMPYRGRRCGLDLM
jgi:hypothetical protein